MMWFCHGPCSGCEKMVLKTRDGGTYNPNTRRLQWKEHCLSCNKPSEVVA